MSPQSLSASVMNKTVTRGWVRAAVFVAVLMGGVTTAWAQSEDVEPRIIGSRGVTLLGLSGSLSRFFSSEELMTGTYTVQADGHRFLSRKIALRFGLIGSNTFGGASDDTDSDDSDSDDADSSDSSSDNDAAGTSLAGHVIEALGGAIFYFTPESIWSFYGGSEYRARLTNRAAGDAGSVNAIVGLQGALSSRAAFFLEGGYGLRLRRGDEGELQTRIVGQAGVRFRF